MGALDGRVVVITGAGRGLGREYALLMAAEGAKVVVNDLGGGPDGGGADTGPAHDVVEEIEALGGEAFASTDDITDWEGGKRLVEQAVTHFGDLHVLINNAGILRDRRLINMTEEEWDSVMRVHLRGHFVPSRWAAAYWRDQTKQGRQLKAALINTTSGSGLLGNIGQANYAAAKAGITAFTIVAAMELAQYGVRCNVLAPYARTRLTLQTPGMDALVKAPDDPAAFDVWDPANVAPVVAYLATEDCPISGAVLHVGGGEVGLFRGWDLVDVIHTDGRFTIGELAKKASKLLEGRPRFPSVALTMEEMGAGFVARYTAGA